MSLFESETKLSSDEVSNELNFAEKEMPFFSLRCSDPYEMEVFVAENHLPLVYTNIVEYNFPYHSPSSEEASYFKISTRTCKHRETKQEDLNSGHNKKLKVANNTINVESVSSFPPKNIPHIPSLPTVNSLDTDDKSFYESQLKTTTEANKSNNFDASLRSEKLLLSSNEVNSMMQEMGNREDEGLEKNYQGRVESIELSEQKGCKVFGDTLRASEGATIKLEPSLEECATAIEKLDKNYIAKIEKEWDAIVQMATEDKENCQPARSKLSRVPGKKKPSKPKKSLRQSMMKKYKTILPLFQWKK